jgi:hypothetical protein
MSNNQNAFKTVFDFVSSDENSSGSSANIRREEDTYSP